MEHLETRGGSNGPSSCKCGRHRAPAKIPAAGWRASAIHVLKGRFKVRCGDETFILEEGGFAYLPAGIPHAFLNLTNEQAEIIVVYVPGGGHKFYEELGPISRAPNPDRAAIAAVFAKHDMTLLGAPLTAD